ncbi:hypothetical protein J2T56_001243 [Natronobacillus azotifigens]|uniref:DUF4190 domain-containing protein n=1 Tax=Natronobacillus azotifigens TaxID=472978 RepID=A0A9J6RBI3_9BACI|nr:DUF4190 domain-containing protein [Natronobacillus azotifigens]MCZ0703042.1 DUF4190 domain-containing protein [Natronobacillus azotifigens]
MSEQGTQQTVVVQQAEGNGLAVSGMVLGIIAVVLNFIPFLPYVLGALAIIFGAVGLQKPVKQGMAKAGIVLGIVSIAMKILFWMFIGSLI